MHEFAIASAVVESVVRNARGRTVTAVTIRVGTLRQVVPDSLEFAFGIVARETVCDGARLEQIVIPTRLRCDPCTREWAVGLPDFRCPTCGDAGRVVTGEELEIESIVVEEAARDRTEPRQEATCTASG
jgi:hydrogenase nickel incorporation protein HypA/HybF